MVITDQWSVIKMCHFIPAPGAPQSLRVASVDVTNITIQWDRVNCLERNGPINGYLVFAFPTSNPSRVFDVVSGTDESDRMFSVTGLPPQISYTFVVEVLYPFSQQSAAESTIIVSTTAPQSKIHTCQVALSFIISVLAGRTK